MTGVAFLPVWTGMMAAIMLPSTMPLLRLTLPVSAALAAAAVVWAL